MDMNGLVEQKNFLGKRVRRYIFLMLIITTSIVATGCSDEGEWNTLIEPTLINLELLYTLENVEFEELNFGGVEYPLFSNYEPTWFGVSYVRGVTAENQKDFFQRELGVELPSMIEWEEDSFISISIGRQLTKLYYFEESRHDIRFSSGNDVLARPVFDRHYQPNTIFIYRASPLPQYFFMPVGEETDDLRQFNEFNNIPFEVWQYDEAMRGGGHRPGNHPFRFRNIFWRRHWSEFREPIVGVSATEQVGVRSLPTVNSRIVAYSDPDIEFVILGVLTNGEEINNSKRWYFVRLGAENSGHEGYIHSSFVIGY